MRRMIPNTKYIFDWDPVLQKYTNRNKNIQILPEGIYSVKWTNPSDAVTQNVIIDTYLNESGYIECLSGLVSIADENEDWVLAMLYLGCEVNGGGIAITTACFEDQATYDYVKLYNYAGTKLEFTRIG